MKSIIIALLVLGPFIMGYPSMVRYYDDQQIQLQKTYYNIGVAMVRLVDPAARQGIALKGAWSLSESKK